MSDNIKSIHKLSKEIENLLKDKQNQYGRFDLTSHAMQGYMQSFLSAYNNIKVKVPLEMFGLIMITLKGWRTINNTKYKKDTFDDMVGYAELLRQTHLNKEKHDK